MGNLSVILPSGAKLEVSRGSFSECHTLYKVVTRELEKVELKFGVKWTKISDILNAEMGDEILNTIKNVIARITSSDDVEAALWPCMLRGKYDGKAIRPEVFEDDKAMEDFLVIAKEVLVFNTSPFFKNLDSLLLMLMNVSSGNQKSQSK